MKKLDFLKGVMIFYEKISKILVLESKIIRGNKNFISIFIFWISQLQFPTMHANLGHST